MYHFKKWHLFKNSFTCGCVTCPPPALHSLVAPLLPVSTELYWYVVCAVSSLRYLHFRPWSTSPPPLFPNVSHHSAWTAVHSSLRWPLHCPLCYAYESDGDDVLSPHLPLPRPLSSDGDVCGPPLCSGSCHSSPPYTVSHRAPYCGCDGCDAGLLCHDLCRRFHWSHWRDALCDGGVFVVGVTVGALSQGGLVPPVCHPPLASPGVCPSLCGDWWDHHNEVPPPEAGPGGFSFQGGGEGWRSVGGWAPLGTTPRCWPACASESAWCAAPTRTSSLENAAVLY